MRRSAMRLAAVLLFVTSMSALGYYVFSHPSLDRLERLEGELDELESQNEELAERNAQLEREIMALRDDPRLAERRARESIGLARPDELIFQFEEEEEDAALQIRLGVETDRIDLAGRQIEIDRLAGQLEEWHDQLPNAQLQIEFDEQVGPIRRRRIEEIVDDSPINSEIVGEQ